MNDAGLKLPTNLGAPERTPVNKKIRERWDTFDEVEAELQAKGFTDCPRPNSEFPNLTPKELVETPNKEYTALHGTYLEWFRYTAEDFSRLRARILQVKNEMEDIELDIKRDMRSQPGTKKPTEEELNIAVGLHTRYRELKVLLQRADQAKMLLETKVDYLERSLRVISRQVELRKIDAGQGGVNDHMPGRGGHPYGKFPAVRGPGG
jgi:hypothetical protein